MTASFRANGSKEIQNHGRNRGGLAETGVEA